MRELTGKLKWIVGGWAVACSLIHLYTAAFGVFEPRVQRGMHLFFLLPLAFILFPATKSSPKDRPTLSDWILAVLSTLPSIYSIIYADELNRRFEFVTPLTTVQIILGVIAVVCLIEAMRRAVAPMMALLAIVFIAYLFFLGKIIPGPFHFKGMSLSDGMEAFFLLKDEGIYGSITGISATFVFLFVLFGSVIHQTGVGKFFTDFACRAAGGSRGGPAKIAVISSGLFGTISGAAVANVYTTGTFTIPLMKSLGYRPAFAGAVEAAASTGGMLMPPIMGAGAFVMAEMINIPYIHICKAAALGAVLYYFAVGMMVHFEAVKNDLKPVDKSKLPSWGSVLKTVYLLVPLAVLLYLLIIGYTPYMAAFASIVVAILVSYVRRSTWMTPKKLWNALAYGAYNAVMVAVACAGAGLIISVVTNSGIGLTFSSLIVSLSHGYLLIGLMFIMVTSIMLGMGLPATPAYVIAASVGAPAMLKLGVDILSTHLFVFYFAILAAITPPVAIAGYAAAGLAGSDPLKTGFTAFRLALAGFIVPYIFVYRPALIMKGSFIEVVLTFAVAFISVIFLASSLEGWFFKHLSFPERAVFFIVALFLPFPIMPLVLSFLIALAVLGGAFLVYRVRARFAQS